MFSTIVRVYSIIVYSSQAKGLSCSSDMYASPLSLCSNESSFHRQLQDYGGAVDAGFIVDEDTVSIFRVSVGPKPIGMYSITYDTL